jgi:glycosyltransferase involved in cell wall biosynthesis
VSVISTDLKKVLLITYYWPPGSGAGVHRWLRMSKYFRANGYELTVFHPENAAYPIVDQKLCNQIPLEVKSIQGKIIEPAQFLSKDNSLTAVGFASEKKHSRIQRMMIKIRGNFFIPDARMLWIKPSVRKLSETIKSEGQFDAIISTGPPHSTHIIAQKLKKRFGTFWIADFRDPWTGIDFFDELQIGKSALAKHRKMEKAVLMEADKVVTISKNCKLEFESLAPRVVHVITNGFDFSEKANTSTNEKFTIGHFGTMTASRNPDLLWEILGEMVKRNDEIASKLQICLYGKIDRHVLSSIRKNRLEDYLLHVEKVPHHESLLLQQQMQLLLLVVNQAGNIQGIVTGKVFEYMNAHRPILAVGPESGDLAKIIGDSNSGHVIDYTNEQGMERIIKKSFEAYQEGTLNLGERNLAPYWTKELTKEFCSLLP